MLPVAIPNDEESEPAVVALTINAPTNIAGEMRYPRSKTAAKASPVGGQMGVALGLIEASNRLNLANAT